MYTAKKEGNDTLTANGQSTVDYKAKYDSEDSGNEYSSSTDGFRSEPTDGSADDEKSKGRLEAPTALAMSLRGRTSRGLQTRTMARRLRPLRSLAVAGSILSGLLSSLSAAPGLGSVLNGLMGLLAK